ncbi:MAG TPA: response regulator, partial [Bacteroidia bacterium]|nr:response regulator [Bacteroidia bacterium]
MPHTTKEYRILHIEDSAIDVDLVKRVLTKGGMSYQYYVACNKEEFIKGVNDLNPNVILCDHSLPQFDSIRAFDAYREMNLEVAFLLVTGSVSEEYAVEMMRKGIDDYLLKDNLQRLPKAIENAFNKRERERLRKIAEEKLAQSELLLNKAQQLAHIGSLELDIETKKEIWSNEIYRILGLRQEEIEPSQEGLLSFIHPDDIGFVRTNIE